MRALKLLVIVMGVLIVVGVVALVAIMAGPLGPRGAAPGAAAGFGRSAVDPPAGAVIAEMQGAGDRVVLRLVLPGGRQELLVIDSTSGKTLGTIELRPQP